MSDMANLSISSDMVMTCCLDLLRDGVYSMAGKFVRWSLLQGGPGLLVFSPAFYSLWIGDDDTQVNASLSHEAEYITDSKICDLALQVHCYAWRIVVQWFSRVAFLLVSRMADWLSTYVVTFGMSEIFTT